MEEVKGLKEEVKRLKEQLAAKTAVIHTNYETCFGSKIMNGLTSFLSPAHILPEGHKLKALLFRASGHNFEAQAFHRFCDQRGKTLVIAMTSDKRIIGGYTDIPWQLKGGAQKGEGNSFVFHVVEPRDRDEYVKQGFKAVRDHSFFHKYMAKQGTYEVYHEPNTGPYFTDFCIGDQDDHSFVRSRQLEYGIPRTELTGKQPINDFETFLAVEYEVYLVENITDTFKAIKKEEEREKKKNKKMGTMLDDVDEK